MAPIDLATSFATAVSINGQLLNKRQVKAGANDTMGTVSKSGSTPATFDSSFLPPYHNSQIRTTETSIPKQANDTYINPTQPTSSTSPASVNSTTKHGKEVPLLRFVHGPLYPVHLCLGLRQRLVF